jgi:hypothetical protein
VVHSEAAFATSLYCIAFLTTVYRITVRIRIQRWGWDDTYAVIATLSALGEFALMWASVYESMNIIYHSHEAQSWCLVTETYRSISAFIQSGGGLDWRNSLSGYSVVWQLIHLPFTSSH